MRAGTRVCAWYCVRISPPARTPVNGYAAESVNGQSVVKEEPSMNEGVSDLYTSVQTLIGRSAAGGSNLQQQLLQ